METECDVDFFEFNSKQNELLSATPVSEKTGHKVARCVRRLPQKPSPGMPWSNAPLQVKMKIAKGMEESQLK
jgi:hypothetical protein